MSNIYGVDPVGTAGGDNGVVRDFEDVSKYIVLLKAKGLSLDLRILGQYSGIFENITC